MKTVLALALFIAVAAAASVDNVSIVTFEAHCQFIRLNPKKGPFPILPSGIARNS